MGLWDWILKSIIGNEQDDDDSGVSPVGIALAECNPSEDDSTVGREVDADASEDRWWKPQGVNRTEYAPGVEADQGTDVRAIEAVLVSHFDGHDLAMPPFPQVAERVLQKLRDPRCSMSEIAAVIAGDQVTTANVLRMANSPLYRGLEKITSLQQAVTRLGSTAVRTLMMHHSLKAAVFAKKPGDSRLVDLVWGGSLASATVMRELSRLTSVGSEDAFLIGLLHDIGNVIVLRTVNEEERRFHMTVDVRSFEYLCHICHQEFGELIADAWQLPERVKKLIRDHHSYPDPENQLRTERLMLIVADMINQMLGYAPEVQYDLLSTPAVEELGLLNSPGLDQSLAELPSKIEEVIKSLA